MNWSVYIFLALANGLLATAFQGYLYGPKKLASCFIANAVLFPITAPATGWYAYRYLIHGESRSLLGDLLKHKRETK